MGVLPALILKLRLMITFGSMCIGRQRNIQVRDLAKAKVSDQTEAGMVWGKITNLTGKN